jgi:hypothetical protein
MNHVDVVGTFTECNQVNVNVDYTQNLASVTISVVSLCGSASELIFIRCNDSFEVKTKFWSAGAIFASLSV